MIKTQADRIQELKNFGSEVIRLIEAWMEDGSGGGQIPGDVELIIKLADLACAGGDIPQSCRELSVAISRLAEEFGKYERREPESIVQQSGAPSNRFWAAARAVAVARNGADERQVAMLPPMFTFIDQGVSKHQIAAHIFGYREEGPFMSGGAPNEALIERQVAAERFEIIGQGQKVERVIPADWVPPWWQQAVDQQKSKLSGQLEKFAKAGKVSRYVDPGTIEDMLRDGCYIQQIERGKGVSREQVLETARRLGLKAVDGPAYQGQLQPSSIPDEPDEESGSSVDNSPNDGGPPALTKLIVEEFERSNGTKGAPEIAEALRQAGHEVTASAVTKVIRDIRKNARASAST